MRRLLAVLVALLCAPVLSAPTASDPNEGLQLTQESTGVYNLSWWGRSGWTYFIQQSDDLVNWHYVPVVEAGGGEVISWGFSSTAERQFFRLRLSDAPAGGDPEVADFDGDGMGNAQELAAGGDPLNYYRQGSATVVPVLEQLAGDNQYAPTGQFTGSPLVVRVRDAGTGAALVNAPVTFAVGTGGGKLAATNLGSPSLSDSLLIQTDASGNARVYFQQPASPQPFGTVSAVTGPATPVAFQVSSTPLTLTPLAVAATVPAGTEAARPLRLVNHSEQGVSYALSLENTVVPGDGQIYDWLDSDIPQGPPYSWTDISATGTLLSAVSDADDDFEAVPLSFEFPFYGTFYDEIFVSSNGYLTLGEGSDAYGNASLPGGSVPGGLIAAFFDDLNPGETGDIYFLDQGDRCIVQFEGVGLVDGSGTVTFQIVLHENGRIEYFYKTLTGTLDSATVGIQNPSRDIGVTVAHDAPYLKNQLAVQIVPEVRWFGVTPLSGTLAAGQGVDLEVVFKATLLTSGLLEGGLTVDHDHPDQAGIEAAVTMRVNPGAPSVVLVEPVAPTVALQWQTLALKAEAEDESGIITRVEFYAGTTKVGEDSTAPYQLNWSNLPVGTFQLTARAYDDLGTPGDSQAVTLQVLADTDRDGLADAWELQHFGDLVHNGGGDEDEDQRSNLDEYLQGTSPRDFFNGDTPRVLLVSGNNQTGGVGGALAAPLVIKVTTAAGVPIAGAPVRYAVGDGNGSVLGASGIPAIYSTTTDGQGVAQAVFLPGTNPLNRIIAGVLSQPPVTVSFSAYTSSGLAGGGGYGDPNAAPSAGGGGDAPDLDLDPTDPRVSTLTLTSTDRLNGMTEWDESFDPTKLTIEWNTVVPGLQYILERKVSDGPWQFVQLVSGSGTLSVAQTGLEGDTRYHYRLFTVVSLNGQTFATEPSSVAAYEPPLLRSLDAKKKIAFAINPGIRDYAYGDSGWVPRHYLRETVTWNISVVRDLWGVSESGTSAISVDLFIDEFNDLNYDLSYEGSSSTSTYEYDIFGNYSSDSYSATVDPDTGNWTGRRSISVDSAGQRHDVPYTEFSIERINPTTLQGSYHLDSGSWTATLSDEYPVATFISDTHNLLGDYPQEWDRIPLILEFFNAHYQQSLTSGRNLHREHSYYGAGKVKYKLSAFPASGRTVKWMEVYVEEESAEPEEERTFVQNIRSWTINSSSASESPEYELDGTVKSKNGHFELRFLPRLEIGNGGWGGLDEDELEHPVRVGKGEDGALIFHLERMVYDGYSHVVNWSGDDDIEIHAYHRASGQWVKLSRGQVMTYEEYGMTFRVYVGENAVDGDRIDFSITFKAPDGTTLNTEAAAFEFQPRRSLSVPVDESAGARYRKIALNGRPLPDGKPQTASEDDQQAEETFVDALTLGLRYSSTDAYVPTPGTELPLEIRRDFQTEIWTTRSGLRPHERVDRPFGAAWGSNLVSAVRIVESPGNNSSTNPEPNYAYVTDENGSTFRFAIYQETVGGVSFTRFFPMPTGRHEKAAYLASLAFEDDRLVFRKKFGSVLRFEATSLLHEVAQDRLAGHGAKEKTTYYRLATVTDRLGQSLSYDYETLETLVPKVISVDGRADQALFIQQNANGLVTAIWDPNWNKTQYSYVHDNTRNVWLLQKITAPDGAETQFTYDFAQEADLTPRLPEITDPGTVHIHCDLASVQDPNGKVYGFEYRYNHDGTNTGRGKYNFKWDSDNPELAGYYATTGHPRQVKKVTLPDGAGLTEFEDFSKVKIERDPQGKARLTADSLRKTRVIDAEGHARTYQWSDGVVHEVDTFREYFPSQDVSDPKIVYFTTMAVTHEGYGTETFQFSEEAGMALNSSTDLSGNTTTFAFGDAWAAPVKYRQILPLSTGLNGFYEDPTSQTNALGKTRSFSYDSRRIMTQVVDEEGQRTVYDTDALGRRTQESVYSSTNTLVQQTAFEYGDSQFPGFITRKTVKSLAGDPAWAGDLVTEYVPDGAGRVAQEIVAPSGLALTTTTTYLPNGSKRSVTNPRGHTTWFHYDKRNRLIGVENPDATEKEIAYDSRGNKVREEDENGHATLFEYDGLNRVIRQARDMNGNGVIDAPDLVTQQAYNAVGSVTTSTDSRAKVTTYVYDGLQRLKEQHAPMSATTLFQYGANSGGSVFDSTPFKPTRSEDPRGYVTGVTYDALYRAVETRTGYGPGAVAITTTDYDDVGNAIEVTDPLGKHMSTEYDALNRPAQVTFDDATFQKSFYTSTGLKWKAQDELGRTTATEYDRAARAVKVTLPPVFNTATGLTESPVVRTEYDEAGNVSATINALGRRWEYEYDNRNRKVSEKHPEVWDAETAAYVHPTIETDYDDVGNVVQVVDARGYPANNTYDEANRMLTHKGPLVTKPDNTTARPVTVTTYDKSGHVLTVTDPNGKVTTNTYDDLGRLETTTDAEGMVVTNEYDKVGNRTAVIDGKNQRTEFEYDGLNRNTVIRDALNRETVFVYNNVNKTARVDAMGQRTEYGYDDRHRLETVTYVGRTADNRSYDYDAVGNLLGVSEPGKAGKADVAYTYDALNRPQSETSGGVTHQYRYDLASNRTLVTYGGTGREIVSTYDALNRLATMTENGRITSYAYNAVGAVSIRSLPNGDATTTLYDALNRATQIQGMTAASGLLYTQTMKHDLVGNVAQVSEVYPSGLANRTVVNTYDDVYRLVTESTTTAGSGTVSVTYGYDDANNRSQKIVTGGPTPGTTDYSYNSINQLTGWTDGTSTVSYTYDLNGNRASRTQGANGDALAWDYENRLVSFDKNTGEGQGLYSFVYDYRTRRIETVKDAVPATKFVFSGGTSVQEFDGGVLSAELVRGSDIGGGVGGLLYSLRSGTPSYTHYNARGDVVAKTDGVGALTYQAAYEAWGEIKAESGSTQDRQKSNSKDRDVPGYANEGFRYRDLETGVFLSKDPAGFVDGPNVYAYVRQNPWTSFDPDGLFLKYLVDKFDEHVAEPFADKVSSLLSDETCVALSENKSFQIAGQSAKIVHATSKGALDALAPGSATAEALENLAIRGEGTLLDVAKAGVDDFGGKKLKIAMAAGVTVASLAEGDGMGALQAGAEGLTEIFVKGGKKATKGGIDYPLKKPPGVSDADWNAKLAAMNEQAAAGKAKVVHSPVRDGKAQKQARQQGMIEDGHDADHALDLQFGGADDIGNIRSTPSRVNRSVGGQGQGRKQHPDGTPIDRFVDDE
ncbi:RHS repeat-associated core domain-containing protein [Verrucomicrobium spinosum]|uniref:RHS repeat-associated core domain-containing protein n=2 Tax=Verrucomicrobium spinosum TaxID=2736 RepID=UPI0001744DEE|nr:RHS repeat-associated core domain-containing protein [Verrucomicrobium spinosum]